MSDSFSSYHPFVNFFYFAVVIISSMFFSNPILLLISLIVGFSYSIYQNGIKAFKFNLMFSLPTVIFIAILNPLFNHEGATILFYLNDNPITMESIIYGISSAIMFCSVIIWFSCYNSIMSSDKFIYLFGKIIPSLSLIFSMTLRFVPKFKAQAKVISNAQKCIGRDVSQGNILKRIKNAITILSILTTWAFENAIETADSMKCRGYGLKGRTAFSNYNFRKRDMTAFLVMALLSIIIIIGFFLGVSSARYFPTIEFKIPNAFAVIVYFAYFLLLSLPLVINFMEDIKWKYLKSKI
ncbi:MAG: energy-coupling factor transporter transmembrane component T [Oscillospiraceae bacterium]